MFARVLVGCEEMLIYFVQYFLDIIMGMYVFTAVPEFAVVIAKEVIDEFIGERNAI